MKKTIFILLALWCFCGLAFAGPTVNIQPNFNPANIGGVVVVDGTTYARTDVGINAAIAALPATGGTVFLPAGTYTISASVALADYVTIQGEGYSTYLVLGTAANCSIFTGTSVTGTVIKDLRCDGDYANQTAYTNVIYFTGSTQCKFINLWVTGANRTGTYGVDESCCGDGLRLASCTYMTVSGGYYYDNKYDGIKSMGSDYCQYENITGWDNGRSVIQLAYGEDVITNYSLYNNIENVIGYHSTGTPDASSPNTAGIYLHTASYNTITGFNLWGFRNPIGLYDGSSYNVFTSGNLGVRAGGGNGARPGISLGGLGVTDGTDFNLFNNIEITGVSGDTGEYIYIAADAPGNKFANVLGTRGSGTSTWKVTITSGATGTRFRNCSFTSVSFNDSGTNTTIASFGVEGIGIGTLSPQGRVHISSEDTHGGILIGNPYKATVTVTATHTLTATVNVPVKAVLWWCEIHVKSALAGGETWNAQYAGGATQTIATAQAVAKNTNVSQPFDPNAATPVTSDTTTVQIQRSSNPGVDNFTAQGTIEVVVWAVYKDTWDND